jgi:hypothetical protein
VFSKYLNMKCFQIICTNSSYFVWANSEADAYSTLPQHLVPLKIVDITSTNSTINGLNFTFTCNSPPEIPVKTFVDLSKFF